MGLDGSGSECLRSAAKDTAVMTEEAGQSLGSIDVMTGEVRCGAVWCGARAAQGVGQTGDSASKTASASPVGQQNYRRQAASGGKSASAFVCESGGGRAVVRLRD